MSHTVEVQESCGGEPADVFEIRVPSHSSQYHCSAVISVTSHQSSAAVETVCLSIAMAVPSAASYRAFPGLHRAIGGSGTQNAHGREQSEDYEHPMNIEEVRSRTSSGAANICSKLRVRNRSVRFIIFAVKLS